MPQIIEETQEGELAIGNSQPEIAKITIPEHDSLVGGRLQLHKEAWSQASRWQKDAATMGIGWKFISQPPTPSSPVPTNPRLETEIQKLIQKKVIIKTEKKPKWFCRLFTREKSDGSLRMIADLSSLNEFIKPIKFKMHTLQDLQKHLNKEKWLVKIDIKDAFHHIPIKKYFQSFLGILFGGNYYQFAVLPFGLSAAPAIFTGILGYPIKLAKENGINCMAYLDDIIIWADTSAKCRKDGIVLMNLLHKLGFQVHPEKSILEPSQSITWLGVEWNGKNGTARYPEEASENVALMTKNLITKKSSSRREMESLLGKMAFIAQINPEAQIKKKMLGPPLRSWFGKERDKRKRLGNRVLNLALWWTSPKNISKWHIFRRPTQQGWIWTDASLTGKKFKLK